MLESVLGFDILGVGAAVGALGLLVVVLWFLLANAPLEDLNQRHAPKPKPETQPATDRFSAPVTGEEVGGPQPRSPRRAA